MQAGPGARTTTGRRRALSGYAALLALGAYGGALGLMVGFLDLPTELDRRLPFDSPMLGGIALALVVAVPATVLTVLAWRGDPRTDLAAVLDGILLIGWILVEVAFLGAVAFLHVLYLLVGVSLVVWGRPALGELARAGRHSVRPRTHGHA